MAKVELLHACVKGDCHQIAKIAADGYDPGRIKFVGQTPLEAACSGGHLDAVRLLIETYSCEAHHRQQVPHYFYLASQSGNVELVKYLIREHECVPNVSLVHAACKGHWKHGPSLEMVNFLVENCNLDPDQTDETGATPLYIACGKPSLTIVRFLVENCHVSPNQMHSSGLTPLHNACFHNQFPIAKYLIENCRVDLHQQTDEGYTPLHLACFGNYRGNTEFIEYLLSEQHCSANCKDNDGNTPLHTACMQGHQEPVKLLATIGHGENCKNKDGITPLHCASAQGHIEIVKYLIEEHHFDPNCHDADGNTPLHEASYHERLDIIKYLIETQQCDPNTENRYKETPLHAVCLCRDSKSSFPWPGGDRLPEIMCYLLQANGDPSHQNISGSTPLHYVCCSGLLHSSYRRWHCITMLLSSRKVDPMCKDYEGMTPLERSNGHRVVHRIFQSCGAYGTLSSGNSKRLPNTSHKHSQHQPLQLYIVGNPQSGKSTLVEALKHESSRLNILISAANRVRNVSGVDPNTAGIIPSNFNSRMYGKTIFYDFAGQSEYYASHSAILQNCSFYALVFLVVLDIRANEDTIKDTLHYWLHFIENQCASGSAKPCITVIGSHADEVESGKVTTVARIVDQKDAPLSLQFFPMDCRRAESPGISKLRQYLKQMRVCIEKSSKTPGFTPTNVHIAHNFSAYLQREYSDQLAVSLSCLISRLTISPVLLYKHFLAHLHKTSIFLPLCEELHKRGDILFLKNTKTPEESWIVLNKKPLLSHVTGTIFAPTNFREHQHLASSTGVVPLSRLIYCFPSYDPNMIVAFLLYFEFCREVSDDEVLRLIEAEVSSPHAPGERYFFFPALISIQYPTDIWQPNEKFSYHCGWSLACSVPSHFFTSRFLQVLLLRLAFFFALRLDIPQLQPDSPVLQRKCSVWKNGIHWLNRDGVETLVEMHNQRTVTLAMRCLQEREVECLQLCSTVIHQILSAKNEFCPKVSTEEHILHPSHLDQYPIASFKITKFSIIEISRAIAEEKSCVVNTTGKNVCKLTELLQFEPYVGLQEIFLRKLFSEGCATEKVTDDFAYSLGHQLPDNDRSYLFSKLFKITVPTLRFKPTHLKPSPAQEAAHLFQCWRDQGKGTYGYLRKHLSRFSIFGERNPLVGSDHKLNHNVDMYIKVL